MTANVPTLNPLPAPAIVETVDFETILAARKTKFVEVATANGLDVSEYIALESAPETILLEAAAYAEMALRSRINVVYRSRLAYFATGNDLDIVADDNGVPGRLAGESDAALQARIRIKHRGSSSAGPDDWWRFHALRAGAAVKAVGVTRARYPFPAPGEQRGQVTLSILSDTPTGAPTAETLAAVLAIVSADDVRGTTTRVDVRSAIIRTVPITARVWRRPDAPVGLVAGLPAKISAAWVAAQGLGIDLVDSWLIAALMQPGVHRVELVDFATAVAQPHEAIALGLVTITDAGIDT